MNTIQPWMIDAAREIQKLPWEQRDMLNVPIFTEHASTIIAAHAPDVEALVIAAQSVINTARPSPDLPEWDDEFYVPSKNIRKLAIAVSDYRKMVNKNVLQM